MEHPKPCLIRDSAKELQKAFSRVIWIFALLLIYQVFLGSALATSRDDSSRAALPDLYEASIAELQSGLEQGLFTSVDLVKVNSTFCIHSLDNDQNVRQAYFARIDEVNLQGPTLRAVIEMNPSALSQAAALDAERKATGPRSALHGIPILLKDNIATEASDGMNTTAGSFALLGSIPPRDATVAAKLRAAGAVLLGKANMSEWAHYRGELGLGAGSGIGTAIGLTAAALGTETDGSIVLPSSRNNLVGIKPMYCREDVEGWCTVIPASVHQDTIGPMARSVADAAAILTIISGRDPLDNFTSAQPPAVPDFSKALKPDGLKGVRLGVPRLFQGSDQNVIAAFNASIEIIRGLGATVVDPAEFPDAEEILASNNETIVVNTDLKVGIKNYISGLLKVPTGVTDLADLIAFNIAHADEELIPPFYADQSLFIGAENTTVDAAYYAALAADKDLGQTRGIDGTLKKFNLDAILLPSEGTSFARVAAAIAGYPIVA
ncbi:hypothetical protein EVG20_g10439, partial [Dentipellis fragilis]